VPEQNKFKRTDPTCNCYLLDEIREKQKKVRQQNMERIFEANSLINKSLLKADFDNFIPDDFKKALNQTKGFAESFDLDNPKSLFIRGTFGTGKSHLSVAITKVLTRKGYSAIFISVPKLLTKIRNTYNRASDQSEEQIIQAITEADLVVFDDIGAEGDISGWGMQKLFEVIDQRAGKHCVYTTNLKSKDFQRSLDMQRIFSRMLLNAELVEMDGKDYRMESFNKGGA